MRRVLLATVFAMVVIPAGVARSAYVYAPGDFVEFDALPGERNDVTVTQAASTGTQTVVTIHDAGAPLTPVTGCVPLGVHTLACTAGGLPGDNVTANLDDLDDSIRFVGVVKDVLVDGGTGNDTLGGGDYSARLDGGPGDDTLTGSPGTDVLRGQGGDDTITAGLGQDLVAVGAGTSNVDVRDGVADDVTCSDGGTATVLTDPFDGVDGC